MHLALSILFPSLALAVGLTAADQSQWIPNSALPPKVTSFCADKERQALALAKKLKLELPQMATEYFEAAKKGEWAQATDLYREVKAFMETSATEADQQELDATLSAVMLEVQLALEQFAEVDPKISLAAGNEMVRSIPRGSIYLGGTDAGRGLPTTLCASHEKGDPFFTITQNALASGTYLKYLRTMYGGHLHIPTEKDSSGAFKDYLDDAKRRLEHDRDFPNEPRQIKPGENVTQRDNRISVGGQVAVMNINARLAKKIFDQNPAREFYVEQSFPLDWMFPHLAPHGLIMKLHRQPVAELSTEIVEKDRRFWTEQVRPLFGDWIKPKTSLKEVCAFVEKVFVDRELTGFAGDPRFVASEHATKLYSRLRSSIAGLYHWRAMNSAKPEEQERMRQAAEFAWRQSFALWPSNLEAVLPYANALKKQKRIAEALLLAETAAKAGPARDQVDNLIAELREAKH